MIISVHSVSNSTFSDLTTTVIKKKQITVKIFISWAKFLLALTGTLLFLDLVIPAIVTEGLLLQSAAWLYLDTFLSCFNGSIASAIFVTMPGYTDPHRGLIATKGATQSL